MRAIAQEVAKRDAELTLIGNGTPEQGASFQERTETPFRVLADPELVGYRAMELESKLFGGFRPQTPWRALRVWLAGFRGHGTQGDPHQLGGVFIITPDHEVVYSYTSKTLDDRVDPREIVKALDRLREGKGVSRATTARG